MRTICGRIPSGTRPRPSSISLGQGSSGTSKTARLQRDDIVHPDGLLHHERLAVFDARQVAVEARHSGKPLADLLLAREQADSLAGLAVLRAVAEQCRHPSFEL